MTKDKKDAKHKENEESETNKESDTNKEEVKLNPLQYRFVNAVGDARFPSGWKPDPEIFRRQARNERITLADIPNPVNVPYSHFFTFLGVAAGFYVPVLRNRLLGLPGYYNAGYAILGAALGGFGTAAVIQELKIIQAKVVLVQNPNGAKVGDYFVRLSPGLYDISKTQHHDAPGFIKEGLPKDEKN